MTDPKVTEYTTVDVDDRLANNVSVRTQVKISKPEVLNNVNGDGVHRKYDVNLIDEDYATKHCNIVTNEIKPANTNDLKIEESLGQNGDKAKVMPPVSSGNNGGSKAIDVNKPKWEGQMSKNLDALENNKRESDEAKDIKKDVVEGTRTITRIEKHKTHVMEHNLIVSGVRVSERKETTTITQGDINDTNGNGVPIKTILTHSRTLGDRVYTIKDTKDKDGKTTNIEKVTAMSGDEVKKFEADWKDYWIPTISDEQIESGQFEELAKETEENVIQFESADRVSAGALTDSYDETDEPIPFVFKAEDTEGQHSPIEEYVRRHPLKIFYFGLAMLLIAVFVVQCCFLPDYPPCSWMKAFLYCILECVEKTNAGESY